MSDTQEETMAYYHGHYREAIRSCTPYLLDEYAIRCNVEELVTFLFSRGHLSDDQTQFINDHERTRDRMRLLLEDIESNANIATAFDDMLEHMSTDDLREDIPNMLGETLERIARAQNDWQYVEAIRKCLPFLTKNISKSTIGDIVDHMAAKGHILLHEQQYIHETTRISQKQKLLFDYLMESRRDNKGAFTDLIEKLYEDKFREDIPKKLEETLDAIKKTSSEHEETVYRTLKRLDILYIPEEKGTDQLITEPAQHSDDSNLFDAAMRSDYERFERLLQDSDDPDAINRRNENGQTPLIVSCKYADANFVQKLIENEATDVNASDIKGRTAFFYAIMRCDKQLVSMFINSQVDISTRDKCGLTFIWCIFGEDIANELALTVKNMYMKNDKMAEAFISIFREKRTDLNWAKIMDIVRILVENEKVNNTELLKTMILAAHVPAVSYILQHANIRSEQGDIIYDIILNGISTNNVDIFRLLLECPNITLGLLNMWSVNALLKYTLTSHSSRSIKAMMLKLSRGIRVDPALKTSISLLCLDDEAIPLPEILEGYDMTRLNVSDATHNTVFMILCQYGSEALVSELLTHPEINFMAQNKYGQTAFMVALKSRSEEVARLLLQHVPSHVDPNKCDIDGMNGLLIACESKCDTIVHMLLGRKEVDVNVAGGYRKQTALMEASFCGRDHVVSMLMGRKELDVNVTDRYGQTALTLASEGGHDTIVAMLLAREADVNVVGGGLKQSALVRASKGGYDNVVRVLLRRNELAINVADKDGQTALMLASSGGYDRVVSMLLVRTDVDVNATGGTQTALMLASGGGHDMVVSMLLARTEVHVNATDIFSMTALMRASAGGHDKAVSMLLGRTDVDVNVTDGWRNQTALILACRGGRDKVVSLILGRNDVNVSAVDKLGRTALLWASRGGHGRIVSMLLERSGVDVNEVGDYGRTALMLASESGHAKTVSLLLGRNDVDVNTVDKLGRTALMWASRGGHDTTVAMLLGRSDVDVNLVDKDGLSAMMLASSGGHAGVVDMLMARDNVDSNSTDS